jgi:hypothetical protein
MHHVYQDTPSLMHKVSVLKLRDGKDEAFGGEDAGEGIWWDVDAERAKARNEWVRRLRGAMRRGERIGSAKRERGWPM